MLRVAQVWRLSGPRTRSLVGSRAASRSWPPAASPARPVQRASSWRVARVLGWSKPRTRSLMGSRQANWSRAPAASLLPGPEGEAVAGGQGVGMVGAENPLADGQQGGEPVTGRRPHPLPGRSSGRVCGGWPGCRDGRGRGPARGWGAGPRNGRGPRPHLPPGRSSGRGCGGWSGCRGGRGPNALADGQQGGELVAGPAASPAFPVHRASWYRVARVSGCSGPGTRSRTGSRAANWSRAPAASPASPVQEASSWRASGCGGRRDPERAPGREAGRRAGRGPPATPPPPRSRGELVAGVQGVGVLRARTRSRTGSRAASWSRAPAESPAFPVQRASCGGRPGCRGVPGRRRRRGCARRRSAEQIPGRGVAAAVPEYQAIRHMPRLVRSRTARACGSSSARRPRAGVFAVSRDRRLDHGRGGLPHWAAASA